MAIVFYILIRNTLKKMDESKINLNKWIVLGNIINTIMFSLTSKLIINGIKTMPHMNFYIRGIIDWTYFCTTTNYIANWGVKLGCKFTSVLCYINITANELPTTI